MDLASVVAALASVGVRVSGSTPDSSVQVDSSRACPTGLAGPEPSGTINDPGQHFQPHKMENPASQFFLLVPANAPTTLLCEPFQWGPVWDVWSTMLIGPCNPYTDRVSTGVFFYNNCAPVHGPMPHKIENPASQYFLPVPANAPTTLLCEPFQSGPVWDVWSPMLIGPWNPYTDRDSTGVFFYNNCPPVHGPMPHKIENPASQFFYLCPQMHPRPYYVSHSNGAQCGMCGQPC